MKRNKPLNKSAFAAACAIACSTALAETISWYHFDEGEIGTKPAGATAVFVDSVTGVADGKAYAHEEGKFNTTENAMPKYCKAFPNSACWYDPVSKAYAENNKCLRFFSPNGDYSPASLVTLDDREAYHSNSLTIEAFIRVERDYEDRWRFIVAKPGEKKDDGKPRAAWFMGINGAGGKLFMYVTTKVTAEDGSVSYKDSGETDFGTSVLDGKWHHVAMVIDGANKKIYKYLDYKLQVTASYTGEIAYGDVADNNMVYVGKYWGSYGCFPGSIDEVRISSGVLTEKEFLRPNFGAKDCLPETVLYMPFEGLDDFGHLFGGSWRTNMKFLNQALPHESAIINSITFSKDDDALVIMNDAVNAAFTRRNIAAAATANTIVLKTVSCPTATKEVCPKIIFNDQVGDLHSAFTGSFTFEFFAKFNMPNPLSGNRYITMLKGKLLPLYLTETGALAYNPEWKNKTIYISGFCDDQWHHIAIVYDRPNKTHLLYLDYKLKGSVKLEAEIDPAVYPGGSFTGNNFIFGWYDDNEGGVSGLFDGIRLTTKALEPQDFLTTRAVASVSYSMMLDFEESITAVKPYGDIIPAGVNAAMENGAQATLDNEVVTTLVREYNRGPERTNRKSLRLAGSKVTYPRNVLIEELEDQTIEFFLRGTSAAQNCGIIALEDNSGNPVWSLTANSVGNLVLNVGDTSWNLNTSMTDGRWNHFALSFGKNENGTIAMNIYRNRTLMQTAEIPVLPSYAMTKLVLGGGEGIFNGNIDEIRISPKVLSADELMQPYIKGTRVIVR